MCMWCAGHKVCSLCQVWARLSIVDLAGAERVKKTDNTGLDTLAPGCSSNPPCSIHERASRSRLVHTHCACMCINYVTQATAWPSPTRSTRLSCTSAAASRSCERTKRAKNPSRSTLPSLPPTSCPCLFYVRRRPCAHTPYSFGDTWHVWD